MRQQVQSSGSHFESQTRLRVLAAQFARALLRLATLLSKRAQGRPGAGGTCGPLREKHTQKEPHSSIQVKPNTRPSLRDGLTAYAVLSREPSSFWPPSLPRIDDALHPVGIPAPPRKAWP